MQSRTSSRLPVATRPSSAATNNNKPSSRRRPRSTGASKSSPSFADNNALGEGRDLIGPLIRLSRSRTGTRDVECLEDDLIMVKKELKEREEALRQMETHVTRLESEVLKRDKSIEILLSRRYSSYTPGKSKM